MATYKSTVTDDRPEKNVFFCPTPYHHQTMLKQSGTNRTTSNILTLAVLKSLQRVLKPDTVQRAYVLLEEDSLSKTN